MSGLNLNCFRVKSDFFNMPLNYFSTLQVWLSAKKNGFRFNVVHDEFFLQVEKMLAFSVLTPYYAEDVIYSERDLDLENEDGINILFYLQKVFPGLL